jgi:hypothetical protein
MWNDAWKWILNHYIYNALVLIAVVIIVLNFLKRINVSGLVQSFLSRYKKIKIGAGGIELERKEEGSAEKDKQQDGILAAIKEELAKINNRLDIQYKYIREAAIQAGVSVVWSGAKAPFVEIIRAALLNIYLGENGNLRKRLVSVIMEEGKSGVSLYNSILNEFIKEKNNNLSPHFNKTIKWVEDQIG